MEHKKIQKYEFKFHDLGEGLHEGTITKCLCKVGDIVKDGEGLFELDNDKLSDTVLSPVDGV
ncbi:MAG: biotin/lipoyl-containing protein, partial [Candidatus Phytoplasma australasiaticum]|nr:biotin/lipoyl-containing protein [Candidatus Phytoplasma australasiaticum]